MTETEVMEFIDSHPSTFYRVWAKPKPEDAALIEYRFPGISVAGYFIETPTHIWAWFSSLTIEKIEVW